MLDIWYARVGRSKPFLRWAGGKQAFLLRYSDRLPNVTGRYLEPFLGSGAVFFHIMRAHVQPVRARLGDTNRHLIRTFAAVRDQPEDVYEGLATLQAEYQLAADKAAFYYAVRDEVNALHPKTDPAKFIFVNRTCWNGLYRVNQAGTFNVPYGAPKTARVIPELEELLNASAALTQADLRATQWQNTVALAEPGDFVFLDPPYYSEVERADVRTKYQRRPFSLHHHRELARTLTQLTARGIDFLLTNSAEPEMVDLYKGHGLNVELVELPRPINSKAGSRRPVPELIVTPSKHAVPHVDLDAEVLLLPE